MLLTFLLPKEKCAHEEHAVQELKAAPLAGYSALFIVCLLTVFRVVPDWACLIAAILTALVFNRGLLAKVDYPLLATFVCFFIFVGNIARISSVSEALSGLMDGREMLVSCALSQVISNVPAAMMLSGFTGSGTQLLLGVNLGGLGTLIASLASLISFQFYRKTEGASAVKYMAVFSAVNFGMLILLLLLQRALTAIG